MDYQLIDNKKLNNDILKNKEKNENDNAPYFTEPNKLL